MFHSFRLLDFEIQLNLFINWMIKNLFSALYAIGTCTRKLPHMISILRTNESAVGTPCAWTLHDLIQTPFWHIDKLCTHIAGLLLSWDSWQQYCRFINPRLCDVFWLLKGFEAIDYGIWRSRSVATIDGHIVGCHSLQLKVNGFFSGLPQELLTSGEQLHNKQH